MIISETQLITTYFLEHKDCTLVDVGAHQGFFLDEFIKRGWKVIAFEAEITNYKELTSKYKECTNITCIQKAVYDKSGLELPFYISEKHYGIHSLEPFHKTHKSLYNVHTIRLDQALKELEIETVDLLKIDIEGADFLALKSFDFNKNKPEIVITEFMDDRSSENFGYTHHDVAKYMEDFGYTTYISEWEPIEEYAIEHEASSHKWIQCIRYPLDHEPAWGNMIFVLKENTEKFDNALRSYITKIRWQNRFDKLKNFMLLLLPHSLKNKLINLIQYWQK